MHPTIAITLVVATSVAGGYFTRSGMEWYKSRRPTHAPPPYVFPIVWTILYALLAVALSTIPIDRAHTMIVSMFVINLALNVLWCYVYFRRHSPVGGLVCFAPLIATTIAIMVLGRHNIVVVACLSPYLIWLVFATFLNFESIE
jgi:translocator protein